MKSNILSLCFILSVLVSLWGCEKDPGEGGSASIRGMVHVTDYNATFQVVQDDYPGRDEDVFIIYGDDYSFSDRTRTSYDGKFEFKYLREGDYKIYVYSEDTSIEGTAVVLVPVEIKDKNDNVDIGTLEIKKN